MLFKSLISATTPIKLLEISRNFGHDVVPFFHTELLKCLLHTNQTLDMVDEKYLRSHDLLVDVLSSTVSGDLQPKTLAFETTCIIYKQISFLE